MPRAHYGEVQQRAVRPDQRLSVRYRFDDPNMDLFFMSALSMGPAGGLDIGQAFYVASRIVDGDADSWVQAFEFTAAAVHEVLLETQACTRYELQLVRAQDRIAHPRVKFEATAISL